MNKTLKVLMALLLGLVSFTSVEADIIELDTTPVLLAPVRAFYPPAVELQLRRELNEALQQSKAFWESRIIGYSTEIPGALRSQITKLKIRCEIQDIDGGIGGILAFARNEINNNVSRIINADGSVTTNAIVMEATLVFDLEDLQFMSQTGELFPTAQHEMCHALGFGGGILTENGLSGALNGVGLNQYIGGQYALQAYRKEAGNPVASFIPLQQTGAGSAGSHWAAGVPAFDMIATQNRQEVMLATAGPIGVQYFVSETTWGLLADLGYAVTGINDQLVAPPGIGKFQKIYSDGSTFPFGGQGVDVNPDNDNRKISIVIPYYKHGSTVAAGPIKVNASATGVFSKGRAASSDPFNLRNQSWKKSNNQGISGGSR